MFKKEHITLETSKIETFRKYKRFKIFNSLEKAGFGFVTGTFTGGLIGFLGGYNGGFAKVDSDRATVGVLFGLFFGAASGAALGTGGFGLWLYYFWRRQFKILSRLHFKI